MKKMHRFFAGVVIAGMLVVLTPTPSTAYWCEVCSVSRGSAVGACSICVIERLFLALGGWD
jgi:hypothetical protein